MIKLEIDMEDLSSVSGTCAVSFHSLLRSRKQSFTFLEPLMQGKLPYWGTAKDLLWGQTPQKSSEDVGPSLGPLRSWLLHVVTRANACWEDASRRFEGSAAALLCSIFFTICIYMYCYFPAHSTRAQDTFQERSKSVSHLVNPGASSSSHAKQS